ncbi:MAG: hypothetical protein H0Z28_12960 [Archaeoglobus sp.]|nr:hypothetical protein [Archaeoglobus sp.]
MKIDDLPRGSFLYHWMKYCHGTYPKIVEKNFEAFFFAGCQLLAHAGKLFVQRSKPMPCNFFLVILGKPAAGKGRIIDCLKDVIGQTWIQELVTGSVESIEESLDIWRFSYLIWDEMGELGERSQSYLDRIKYLLNKAYYLDRITRGRTTKKTVDIPRRSYYLSVLLAGLPEDWKKIEAKFLGGFERRFLPVTIQRAKLPFEPDEPQSEEALGHLAKLVQMINWMEDKAFLVEADDLSHFQELTLKVDERYWSMIEEYAHKIDAVLKFNLATVEFEKWGDIEPSYHQNIIQSTENNILMDVDGINDVYKIVIDGLMENKNSQNSVTIKDPLPSMLRDGIFYIIRCLQGFIDIADATLNRCIQRIDDFVAETGKRVIGKWDFASKVLSITNADYYKHIIFALEEMQKIKTIVIGKRKQFVVLDTNAKICFNCSEFWNCFKANKEKFLSTDFDPEEEMDCYVEPE